MFSLGSHRGDMMAVVAHSREGGVQILSLARCIGLGQRKGWGGERGTNLGHLLGWCIWLKSPSGDKMGGGLPTQPLLLPDVGLSLPGARRALYPTLVRLCGH